MNYDRELTDATIHNPNITNNLIDTDSYYRPRVLERVMNTDSNSSGQAIPVSSSLNYPNPIQYTTHGEYSYPLHIQPSIEESTVAFDDWTPQDSSYGAAFPFCGWIPKKIRRRIEKLVYFSTGLFVIYVIVMISMILFGSGNHRSTSTSSFNMDDDDHYISVRNDDADYRAYWSNYKDDDDLYKKTDDKY